MSVAWKLENLCNCNKTYYRTIVEMREIEGKKENRERERTQLTTTSNFSYKNQILSKFPKLLNYGEEKK